MLIYHKQAKLWDVDIILLCNKTSYVSILRVFEHSSLAFGSSKDVSEWLKSGTQLIDWHEIDNIVKTLYVC